jgi:predicted ATPase
MEELNNLLDISSSKKSVILHKLLDLDDKELKNNIDISNNVYNDIKIDDWVSKLSDLEGTSIVLNNIIKTPVNDKDVLLKRQKSFVSYDNNNIKKYESDVLWFYTLNDEIDEDNSINLLYPNMYFIDFLNYNRIFLDLYHSYKIFIIPIISILYPLSIFYSPYYYSNKYLNLNLTITAYLQMLYKLLQFLFKSSGNIKTDIIKYLTIFFYAALYIYNIYQNFEMAMLVYNLKRKLKEKMNGLCIFINEAIKVIKTVPDDIWKPFYNYTLITPNINLNINNRMNDIYKLWKNDNIKTDISNILRVFYTIDSINSISKLKNSDEWCVPAFVNTKTQIWGMKNPLLRNTQVSNPVDLQKNIIITGPNAAGKTTYVKSITTNIILAQTFGICYATAANIIIYDTIQTFMRISDVLGSKSYFEAEAEYCSNMIKSSLRLKEENKNGLFLMDEPMHSTPPTEGMSVAYAVAEYISKIPQIKLIITTHFHKLNALEQKYPEAFINLCVNAKLNNKVFEFPYKINKGFSNQCIAIELLEKEYFPEEVIASAIYFKNKICNENYSI